jgi:hypothetical protein
MSRNLVRFGGMIAILGAMGCWRFAPAPATQVATAKDGHSQIDIPYGWETTTAINDKADLQIHHPDKDISFVVLSEQKSDFANDVTYRDHSDITRQKLLKALSNTKVGPPEEITVGGRRAVRYWIDGVPKSGRLKVTVVHITVDGQNHFHQLLFSMQTGMVEQQKSDMARILESFKDLP